MTNLAPGAPCELHWAKALFRLVEDHTAHPHVAFIHQLPLAHYLWKEHRPRPAFES